MRATCNFGSTIAAGGKANLLSVHACNCRLRPFAGLATSTSHSSLLPVSRWALLLSQGWAEVAEDVTEAPYLEALATAQSKKVGIWGNGSP